MKKWIIIASLFVIGGLIGSRLTIHYLPNYVYAKFEKKMEGVGIEKNSFRIITAPDENSRSVVKPNPDFAYVSCFFDLSDGPLHITGTMPDSVYWSVAMYEPNTVNFYVKNDQQYASNELNLVLSKEQLSVSDTECIVSPVTTGFILIRALVLDKSADNLLDMNDILKELVIEPL